jgi:hypothetical protein
MILFVGVLIKEYNSTRLGAKLAFHNDVLFEKNTLMTYIKEYNVRCTRY